MFGELHPRSTIQDFCSLHAALHENTGILAQSKNTRILAFRPDILWFHIACKQVIADPLHILNNIRCRKHRAN